jgi:hypothetical protein
LDSIARQDLIDGDQVLIVLDTFAQRADGVQALVASYGFTYVEHNGGYAFQGNPQLNHAMTLATGDYFCALGDDDVYVDGAIARLRKKVGYGRAVLFQFFSPMGLAGNDSLRCLLWSDKDLRVANLSGCCMAAPLSALVPVSAERRCEVDYEWIRDTVAKTGQRPVWMKDCLVIARPDLRNGEPVHRGVCACRGCGFIGFLEDMDRDRLCSDCTGTVLRQYLGAA